MDKPTKNSNFDYFIGVVSVIGATVAVFAWIEFRKSQDLKIKIAKLESQIALLAKETPVK